MTDYRNNDRDSDDDDFSDLPDENVADLPVPESQGGSDDVPDGKYQARVTAACMLRKKKDDSPMLKMELEIMTGKYAKSVLVRFNQFATEQNRGYLKKDLQTMGMTLARWRDLPGRVTELVNKAVEVQVKNREGLPCNVYINKLITGTAPANVTKAAPQPVAQPPKKGGW